MPRKTIRGTGITAREITVYDAKAGEAPPHKAWNDAVEQGGGLFGAISLEAVKTCELILASANAESAPIDSPEDFAQIIDKHLGYAKNEIQNGDADRAARFAFVAGMEWARLVAKLGWEPDALRGGKITESASRGGSARAASLAPRTKTIRDEMRRLIEGGMSIRSAAEHCAKNGVGASTNANEQSWKRRKK